ncbi:hypothetical protein A9Q02_22680 [Candidatus Chloroploca asiatica]|uniref:Uncharacterized protein n=1 Tax=Candidatus Chloroploca asiatica TaxID=1506545 RepID=A0A2H3KWB9_9CHLR|nr:hypothetical protein A9Q02_22680 [Candidatus Chloroploca asiatica]
MADMQGDREIVGTGASAQSEIELRWHLFLLRLHKITQPGAGKAEKRKRKAERLNDRIDRKAFSVFDVQRSAFPGAARPGDEREGGGRKRGCLQTTRRLVATSRWWAPAAHEGPGRKAESRKQKDESGKGQRTQ